MTRFRKNCFKTSIKLDHETIIRFKIKIKKSNAISNCQKIFLKTFLKTLISNKGICLFRNTFQSSFNLNGELLM